MNKEMRERDLHRKKKIIKKNKTSQESKGKEKKEKKESKLNRHMT